MTTWSVRDGRSSRVLVVAGALVLAACGIAGCGDASSSASPTPAASSMSSVPAPGEASATSDSTVPPSSPVPRLSPEQRDTAFVRALATRNIQVGDEQTRTQVAESVCRSLDTGVSVPELVDAMREALGGPTPENTGFIVGAATAIYCPENLPKLQAS